MPKGTLKKAIDISKESVMEYLRKIQNDDLIEKIAKKVKDFYDSNKKDYTPIDSYQNSYGALLEYGKKCNKKDQYIILAHAIYGWMPTVLEIDFNVENSIENAIDTLKNIDFVQVDIDTLKNIDFVQVDDVIDKVRTVAKFTNNSFVGASKFLHFICPDKFAILDSTILNVLKKDRFNLKIDERNRFFSKTSANSMKNFIGYQLIMQKTLKMLKRENPEIKLRDIEKVLFYSVPKKQRKKTKDR